MNRSRKVVYGVLSFAVLTFAITAPGMIQGLKQKRAVDSVFDAYSHALMSGDYPAAYNFCDDSFKMAAPFEIFAGQQRELQSNFGRLKAIEKEGTFVHGKGSPMKWVAVVELRQVYEKRDLHFACELHLENRSWKVFGCKQV